MGVAVVGAGGLGGLLGALLIRQGGGVTFVAPEPTVSILNARGLRVDSGRYGSFAVAANAVTALTGSVDVCVVAVKAMQLEAAMERVPKHVLGEAVVVPFLNGVDHVDVLRHIYGTGVVAGAVRVASTRTAPGLIEHSSPFVQVELALADDLDDQHRERALRFERRLVAAGVDVDVRDDELSMLWGKLIFLCPLALLTTRYGITAGEARTAHRDELVATQGRRFPKRIGDGGGAFGVAGQGVESGRLLRSAAVASLAGWQGDSRREEARPAGRCWLTLPLVAVAK